MKIKFENNKYKKYGLLDKLKDNSTEIIIIGLFIFTALLIGVSLWLE